MPNNILIKVMEQRFTPEDTTHFTQDKTDILTMPISDKMHFLHGPITDGLKRQNKKEKTSKAEIKVSKQNS